MNEESRISVLEEQMKVSNHRIADLEGKTDRIENLTLSVQKLAMSVEQMAKEQVDYRARQNELADKLIELEQAPARDKAKHWEDTVSTVLHYVLTAAAGALLAYIGLNV